MSRRFQFSLRGILLAQVAVLGGMVGLLPCFMFLGLLPSTFVTVAIFVGIAAYRERWQFQLRSLRWATAAIAVLCAVISAMLRANPLLSRVPHASPTVLLEVDPVVHAWRGIRYSGVDRQTGY